MTLLRVIRLLHRSLVALLGIAVVAIPVRAQEPAAWGHPLDFATEKSAAEQFNCQISS